MGRVVAFGSAAWLVPSIVSVVLVMMVALASGSWGMSAAGNAVMILWAAEVVMFAIASIVFWRISGQEFPSLGPRLAAFMVHSVLQGVTLCFLLFATALIFNR